MDIHIYFERMNIVGYSVASINNEDTGVKTKQAQQEQILQMQQLKASKTQENGTKVEDSSAVTATSGKSDTIEISAEGQKALEQLKAAKAAPKPSQSAPKTSTAEASSTETASVAENTSSNASIVAELTEDDDDAVSTTDLYTLSESELKSLVSDGSITRKEMLDELERRSASSDVEN